MKFVYLKLFIYLKTEVYVFIMNNININNIKLNISFKTMFNNEKYDREFEAKQNDVSHIYWSPFDIRSFLKRSVSIHVWSTHWINHVAWHVCVFVVQNYY